MRRLRKNHPTRKKIEKLFELMEQSGLTIERAGMSLIVTDSQNDVKVQLVDLDDHPDAPQHYVNIPPTLEVLYRLFEKESE